MPASGSRRSERGSAIADFALVSVVLVPLFFCVLQLALIWHVKTTLISAAAEGARYGASYDRRAADGEQRTQEVIAANFGASLDEAVWVSQRALGGYDVVEVSVTADVPTLGFWGPTVTVTVQGHAIKEYLP